MWFSGLRGAIAFVLALDLPAQHFAEHYRVLVSTTLMIVLFTILILGGSTLPLLKVLRLHVDTTDVDFNRTQPIVCLYTHLSKSHVKRRFREWFQVTV